MVIRLGYDETYQAYREQLDAECEAAGIIPDYADRITNSPTDAPDGVHNLDEFGYSRAVVRDGRVVSVTRSAGFPSTEVITWSVIEARKRREEIFGKEK